ncbi:DUF3489 domain-containing protein [Nitrosospira briensis]|nr:DUF3489 domain-containing protein [Nitrosospira briensis]
MAFQADPSFQTSLPGHSSQVIPLSQTAHPSQPITGSKQSRLIELLHQPAGASLADLIQATGWQAHSVRGVISGVLRKRLGLAVICQANQDGKRIYRIKPVMNGAETDSAEMAK